MGEPLCTNNIPYKTQGPMLQNPFEKVSILRDQVTTPRIPKHKGLSLRPLGHMALRHLKPKCPRALNPHSLSESIDSDPKP